MLKIPSDSRFPRDRNFTKQAPSPAKVLFAIPPERFRLDREIGNSPTMHIGFAYVVTYVAKNAPVQIRLVDAPVEKINEKGFQNIVNDYRPDILAMTAYTFQIKDAAKTAQKAKERFPNLKTIIGGYHANALPKKTLEEFPAFDFAVYGEGEKTAAELIKKIVEGNPISQVDGIAYRDSSGEAIMNPPREHIQDISELPYPDFSLFPIRKYVSTLDPPALFWLRCVPIFIHRGCPYRCKFCLRSFGNKMRFRSMENVLGEIERDIFEYNPHRLLVLDETFTINREFTTGFLENMIRSQLDRRIKWGCQTRVDTVDFDLLKLAKKAGCRYMVFGIESGDPARMNSMEKKLNLAQAFERIRETMNLGIRVQCTFILGLPDETEASALDTIATSIRLDPSISTYSILTPFPGTEIYEMARRGAGGLRLLTNDWDKYGKQVAGAMELEGLPLQRLLALHQLAYRRFYLRPKKIFNLFLFVTPFKVLSYLFGYFWRTHRKG